MEDRQLATLDVEKVMAMAEKAKTDLLDRASRQR
jgi:hypothetical protein